MITKIQIDRYATNPVHMYRDYLSDCSILEYIEYIGMLKIWI